MFSAVAQPAVNKFALKSGDVMVQLGQFVPEHLLADLF
jgi:hypothetical protein